MIRTRKPFDVRLAGGVGGRKHGSGSAFKDVGHVSGCQGAAVKRVEPSWDEMSRLPDSSRYDILAVMSLGGIRSENHVFGASIWAQQDQAEWVTAVEVPHFIEGESMEE